MEKAEESTESAAAAGEEEEQEATTTDAIMSEDETDDDNSDAFIRKVSDQDYIIKALTPIEDFNEHFKATLSEGEFGTVGGILMHAFGHLPQRNETALVDAYTFRVLYADSRQIHLLRMTVPDKQQVG